MPRITRIEARKHLWILVVAIIVAIVVLLIRAETVNAQIGGSDYQSALTTERLMILGMLGLVVLTWFYLRWRPPPDYDQELDSHPPVDRD